MKYSIYEIVTDDDGVVEKDYCHQAISYHDMKQTICMLRCIHPHRDFVEELDKPEFKRTLKLVVNNEQAN